MKKTKEEMILEKQFRYKEFKSFYDRGFEIGLEQADIKAKEDNKRIELEILKSVKFSFDIHSDMSSRCNGYYSLCRKIEEIEKELKKTDLVCKK